MTRMSARHTADGARLIRERVSVEPRSVRIGSDGWAALDPHERQVALVRASLTTRRQDVPTRRRWE
jgi:hypothetical protein